MSLYPSFEHDMLRDVITIQKEVEVKKDADIRTVATKNESNIIPRDSSTYQLLYPVLSEYMGLDIADPAKLQTPVGANPKADVTLIPAVPGQVNHGLRRLTLCKDAKGRIGLLVSAINNGVFVSFVLKDSPAALVKLRFGDQILQINETLLAGYTAEKAHSFIKKLPNNNINFIVRDRPFERTITMQKDNLGHCGFQFHKGKIENLVKDSSAARNGLVTDHYLLEVQGQNVVGMSDKEIMKIIENAGKIITVTIIPSFLYEQMMKKMRMSFVKAKMDHSV